MTMYEYTSDEIAKILEVDAVIMAIMKPTNRCPRVLLLPWDCSSVLGSTNSATIKHECLQWIDRVLLWNYNKKVESGSRGVRQRI